MPYSKKQQKSPSRPTIQYEFNSKQNYNTWLSILKEMFEECDEIKEKRINEKYSQRKNHDTP